MQPTKGQKVGVKRRASVKLKTVTITRMRRYIMPVASVIPACANRLNAFGSRLARQDNRRRSGGVEAAQGRHPQAAGCGRPIALAKIARIGKCADDNKCEPSLTREMLVMLSQVRWEAAEE